MVSIVSSGGTTLSTSQSTTVVDDPTSTGLTLSDYISGDAAMTAYTNRIDAVTTKISTNSTLISAYQSMQSLLQTLQSAAQALAGADAQGSSADVFAERSASLTSSSSTSADSILTATVDPGTATGSHTVVVQKIATAEQIASADQTSSSTALSYSGSFAIGAGSGAATIAVTSSMTLADIATAINDTSSTSGVSASIVEVSSSQYVLEVSAASTDEAITMTDVSGGILSGLGLADSSGTAEDVITSAQAAVMTVDGITGITRTSNTVGDVITGVTLDLAKSDSSSTVTLSISPNTSDVTSAISTFVSAYNSWRDFYATETAVGSDGTASSTAVLFGNGSLRDANSSIADALSSLVGTTSLGAIGISLNSDNTLSINSASLSSALSDQYSSVASLFEVQTDSSSSSLQLSYDSRSTYQGTLSLSVSVSDGVITSATGIDAASGATVAFTVSGTTLTGASGGLAAGLTFAYSGDSASDLTVSLTQGIGDAIYQAAYNFGNSTNSVVQGEITALTSEDTTLSLQESSLQTQADNYYNILLDRYSYMETQISSANETYKLLTEMMSSSSSSSS